MIEIDHKPGLFDPPEGTTAIVIPCSAEVGANATMSLGFALQAAKKWPTLARNTGFMFLNVGRIAHSITRPYITHDCPDGYIGMPQGGGQPGLPLPYHVLVLPIRPWDAAKMDDDYIIGAVRTLKDLCDGKREEIWWLKEGNIIIPQFWERTKPWSKIKPLIEPWLTNDRYVILKNKATPT